MKERAGKTMTQAEMMCKIKRLSYKQCQLLLMFLAGAQSQESEIVKLWEEGLIWIETEKMAKDDDTVSRKLRDISIKDGGR